MFEALFIYFFFIFLNRTKLGGFIAKPLNNKLLKIRWNWGADKLRYILFTCAVCFTFWFGLITLWWKFKFIEFIAGLAVIFFMETLLKKLQLLIDEIKQHSKL